MHVSTAFAAPTSGASQLRATRPVQRSRLQRVAEISSESAKAHSKASSTATPLWTAGCVGVAAGVRRTWRRRPRGRNSKTSRTAVATDLRASLTKLDENLSTQVGAEVEFQPKEELDKLEQKTEEFIEAELRKQLKVFGSWQSLPKEEFSLEDLQRKGVEASKLLSPEDSTEESVRKTLLAFVAGLGVLALLTGGVFGFLRFFLASTLFVGIDQVLNGGLLENLIIDSIARTVDGEYSDRIARHEAGHLMVAYLIGVMPKAYTLSTWEALNKYRSPNVQAGTVFLDASLQKEVSTGSLSGKSLDKFIFIALGGVAVEYLSFGQAKGGKSDIAQVDNLLQAVGMDQRQGSAQVRWSLLNAVEMLRPQMGTHERVAAAMQRGASVGECIALIEEGQKSSP